MGANFNFQSSHEALAAYESAKNYFHLMCNNGKPKTFKQLLMLKKTMSSQKFAPLFERNMRKIMGLYCSYNPNYDAYPHHEFKYATEINGAYSFPQFFRAGLNPHYTIILFPEKGTIKAYSLPKGSLESSVLFKKASTAHFSNKREKRLTIKSDGPEMRFLESFRDLSLERKLKSAKYD